MNRARLSRHVLIAAAASFSLVLVLVDPPLNPLDDFLPIVACCSGGAD